MKFSAEEKRQLKTASEIIRTKLVHQDVMKNPEFTKKYLINKLIHEEREVFSVILLDSQNKIINDCNLFFGTIDRASVYPREVVKKVLHDNAASVIFAHNHPSGIPEPSGCDRRITSKLIDALSLIDVKVLDHVVVGGSEAVSFSERGWI